MTKGNTQYYRDSSPVEHLNGEGGGHPEDSQEASGMALNYGIEPLWFRFGLVPHAPFNNQPAASVACPTRTRRTATSSPANQDPATPVLLANAGKEARMHVVVPLGTTRGTTINVHGHLWNRHDYVCEGSARNGLAGACTMTEVASRNIGATPYVSALNQGSNESHTPASHFTFRFPSAGAATRSRVTTCGATTPASGPLPASGASCGCSSRWIAAWRGRPRRAESAAPTRGCTRFGPAEEFDLDHEV
jgi:hypothetical protein